MTTILNLYGGPGTGKSTSAAYLFYLLKKAGLNAEMVREYVKKWAWEGRKPQPTDQSYFFAKQARDENILLGKVSHIVTDSPVLLGVHYAREFAPAVITEGVEAMVKAHYAYAKQQGHTHVHVFLKRTKPFNPQGRYQSEDEAKAMDPTIWELLHEFASKGVINEPITCGTDQHELEALMKELVS